MKNASLVQNIAAGFRIDWFRKLALALDAEEAVFSANLVEKLSFFQAKFPEIGHQSGLLCPKTRALLESQYPSLRESLLGPYQSPRALITLQESSTKAYRYFQNIITNSSAVFWTEPYHLQLLGIRGAKIDKNRLIQNSDCKKAQEELDRAGASDYFSSHERKFSDCIVLLYCDEKGNKSVAYYPAALNPNFIWPHGTAHLRDGQYLYRLGLHRSANKEHIRAVYEANSAWPRNLITHEDSETLQYVALNAVSEIEVIRSSNSSLALSLADYDRSRMEIINRNPHYVSANTIRINIHSCPNDSPSSQGCQNIPAYIYGDFIQKIYEIVGNHPLKEQALIPYTLIESSKIDSIA